MAQHVLMERRVAQAGTLQARSTAVDTEAWNGRGYPRAAELLKGRQGTGLSPFPMINTTKKNCRITDSHVRMYDFPLIGDMEVRPFPGRDAMLINLPVTYTFRP